jgi:outer membrane protein, adhesin transport system
MNNTGTRFARMASTAMLAALVIFAGPVSAKTIKEAAERAVTTHPEVGAARFNKRAIEEELRGARAGYLPSIDVRGSIGHEWRNDAITRARPRGPTESGWSDMNRYEAGVSLRQLIFDGFGTDSEVTRQFYRATTAQHKTADSAQILALRAIEAYLEVQRTQRILEIVNQNLKVHQDILNRVQARARGGRGPQSDVDQGQARLSDAMGRVATAKKTYGDAVALYIQAVGEPPDALTDTATPESEMPATVDDAITVAMESAPAVRAAASDVRVAQAATGVADSRFFPVVTAEADYSWTNSPQDIGLRGQSQRFSALLVGRWNIYRGGADIARKRESSARLFEARETLEKSRREISQQTRVSWNAVQSSRERRVALQQQIAANERVRIAYSQQFDRGRRTLLDLLDIQNEIVTNQIDLATEEATIRFGIYRTLASMGRLLQVLAISPPDEATRPPPSSLFHSLRDDLTPRREDLPWSTPADGARRHGEPPAAPAAPATDAPPPPAGAPPVTPAASPPPPQGPTPLPGSNPRP